MRESQHNLRPPAPEELAAYVDGQLEPARLRDVEDWLSQHPELSAELQGHRRMARLWRRTSPETPSAARWSLLRNTIWAGIEDRNSPWRKSRRWWIAPLVVGAVAASALFAIVLVHKIRNEMNERSREFTQQSPPAPEVHEPEHEPVFEVLSPDEIDIITLDLRDRHAIMIGAMPLRDALALLSGDEVEGVTIEPEGSGTAPEIGGEFNPMLWVPIRAEK
jgi:hypothetical protein